MNKPPEQLHLNVQLDDSVSLDKFIECDSTQDFLKILKNSINDQSVSNFYCICIQLLLYMGTGRKRKVVYYARTS